MVEATIATVDRFQYQRRCVENTFGIVLNVGCNEDPAGLQATYGSRVINCDIEEFDSYLDGRPNRVDEVFDMTKPPWPFRDDYAELVLIGDTLEHLYPEEAEKALREAHRVGRKLAITAPRDGRFMDDGVRQSESGYRTHCIEVTEEYLREMLGKTGWEITQLIVTHYGFVPEGYLLVAQRASGMPS